MVHLYAPTSAPRLVPANRQTSGLASLLVLVMTIALLAQNLSLSRSVAYLSTTSVEAKAASLQEITREAPCKSGEPLSLDQLTGSSNSNCPGPEFLHVENVPIDDDAARRLSSSSQFSIPPVVHQTSKSRCVHPEFLAATNKWKALNWTYYFHDDDAVMRLFRSGYNEFPMLEALVDHCMLSGTVRADLWRYMVLWKYGGVYADLDSVPSKLFTADLISETDALFVIEHYGMLSQYFMAVSPRHPIMWYAIQTSLSALFLAADTGKVGAPFATGPHALHRAFQAFRADVGADVGPANRDTKPVRAGFYTGTHNRSVRAIGDWENADDYIVRESVGAKLEAYRKMNITHFSDSIPTHQSCMRAMLDAYVRTIPSISVK